LLSITDFLFKDKTCIDNIQLIILVNNFMIKENNKDLDVYNLKSQIVEISNSLPKLEKTLNKKNFESLQNAVAYILTLTNNELISNSDNKLSLFTEFSAKGLLLID
jgi:hypothetical protein